jgi:hypothetical protein
MTMILMKNHHLQKTMRKTMRMKAVKTAWMILLWMIMRTKRRKKRFCHFSDACFVVVLRRCDHCMFCGFCIVALLCLFCTIIFLLFHLPPHQQQQDNFAMASLFLLIFLFFCGRMQLTAKHFLVANSWLPRV